VIGVDVAEPMLRNAPGASFRVPGGGQVSLALADALALPFPDDAFDCATTAFTVRNVADVGLAFSELRRVVRPGGRIVCLELSQPRIPLWEPIFGFYFGKVVPRIGGLIAGDAGAYTYLPASVEAFLSPEALAAEMGRAGLTQIRYRRLGLGAVTLHVGTA
jgi:demethylmenaquinone methyltransferase/2-methoxy-6-polyprenyl-1,4-benzoquinol methylase